MCPPSSASTARPIRQSSIALRRCALEPKKLSAFVKRLASHPKKEVLNMLLLRALRQAFYDTKNIGHFGLASSAYLHFTSPIRRYPDLVVHRAVRAVLRHAPIDGSEGAREKLQTAAVTASECERKGMEIEREIVDLHRAILMRKYIGRLYEGTVTGLVGSGVFVNVDDPFVDVLVRMESLGPDRYELDDDKLRVVGVRSGDRIALGDRMLVEIEDASILRRTVYGKRMARAEARDEEEAPRAKRKVKKTKATPKESKPPAGKRHATKGARGPKKKKTKKKTKR
jgi:ribonuclease R